MRYYGEYGGRALRAFKADVPYIVGAFIAPEVAQTWPLANRKALENQHKVEWFGPPIDEVPQRPAPKKEELKAPEEPKKEEPQKPKEPGDEPERPKKAKRTKGRK